MVGGGDSAMEEALFLTKFADKVTLDPPPRHACAPPRSCRSGPSTTTRSSSSGTPSSIELLGDDKLDGRRRARTSRPARQSTLPVTGLFVAIGHRPNTDLFKGQLDMDDTGYLVTRPGTSAPTSRASSPAATCRTTSTARPSPPPGSGCMAAIDAERWLEASATAEPACRRTPVGNAASGADG